MWTKRGFKTKIMPFIMGLEGRGGRKTHEGYSDITRKVKVDVPTYGGKIDAATFLDWIITMEDYFDWYEMSDIKWVRFAKMKLIGPDLRRSFKNVKHNPHVHERDIHHSRPTVNGGVGYD